MAPERAARFRELLEAGKTDREIADELFHYPDTKHVRALARLLGMPFGVRAQHRWDGAGLRCEACGLERDPGARGRRARVLPGCTPGRQAA